MMDLPLHTFAGLLGTATMVAAYLALQLGKLHGQGYYYAGLNAVGASLILFSLSDAFNLSSAVMQVIWITISIIGIVRYYILTRNSALGEEERAFVEATVPGLGSIEARRLMDLASWCHGEVGAHLTEQGERNDHIYYLLNGKADVRVDGAVVATLGAHTFVGDMALINDGNATATVALTEPSRYLAFSVGALNRLINRDEEVRRHVKAALSGHVVDKLLRTNRELVGFRQPAN